MNMLVLLFAFMTAPHAAYKNIGDCGSFLESARAPSFEIDAMSSLDLEIDKVLMPTLGAHLRTAIGRQRLRFLLHHPFLDRATIVDRQNAVRILADDTHYRRQLRESLGVIERAIGNHFEYFMSKLDEDHRESLWPVFNYVWPTMWTGTWGTTGAAIASGNLHPLAGGALFFMNFLFGVVANGTEQERGRRPIYPFKPVLKSSAAAAEGLMSRDAEVLKQIGKVFSALQDPEHALDLAATNKHVREISGGWGTFVGSLTFFANRATQRTRQSLVDHAEQLCTLLSMIGELDVLVGLAEHYDAHRDELEFPSILPEEHPTLVSLTAGHHPYVWSKHREASVTNAIALSQNGQLPRFLLLTGPNTGGKSTYMKMIGVNVVLAQIGAPVLAEEMRLTPLALFTNKHAREALDEGESSFSAQSKRVADILTRAEKYPHVLVLSDEILTGTSPEEHTAIERAIIQDLVNSRYVGLLATHDRKLQKLEGTMDGVRNIHVVEDEYTVREGPSRKRNALDVLREAGVKGSIIDDAQTYLDANHPEL